MRIYSDPIVGHIQLQVDEVNCVPLSVVIVCGLPNRATQWARNLSAHVSTVVDLSGTTSAQRVLLSMTVIR